MAFETKSGIQITDFREYLFGLPSNLRKSSDWKDTYLQNKLRGAEDELERSLNCYYTPKVVMSEPPSTKVKGTDYDIAEPAYDYDTDFFIGERWGEIRLRKYPVQSVQSVVFAYPNLDNKIYQVPDNWIRLNGNYGRIRLVPANEAIISSFNAFILSVFSGGRGIPQSIFVTYTAGFLGVTETDDLANDHQDLLELTKQCAVLNILDDSFFPSSVSNSTDGISQSFSADVMKFRESYDKKLKKFRDKVKGIRLAVC